MAFTQSYGGFTINFLLAYNYFIKKSIQRKDNIADTLENDFFRKQDKSYKIIEQTN